MDLHFAPHCVMLLTMLQLLACKEKMPKTVINSYVSTLIDSVCQMGVDIQALLADAPFQQADLLSPNYRISLSDMTRLWHKAITLAKDPYLGLHVGARAQLATFNALAPVVMNCPTLQQVLDYLPQFTPVVSESGEFSVLPSAAGCNVKFEVHATEPPLTHHQIEAIFAAMVVLARQLTGSSDFPQRIEFQHALHADLQEYQHILGCPVLFQRKHNVLVLSQAQLRTPIRLADPSQLEHHAELLQRRLKSLQQTASLAERVTTLFARLPAVEWAPEHVAALLKLPLRSLQRSLQKEGSSYQALLDQFRQQQSKKLLLTTDLSIAQIAEKLGYLNLSSYHRAFQRWYGITPAVFRKQSSL